MPDRVLGNGRRRSPHLLREDAMPLLELANLSLNRGLDLRSVLQQVTDTGTRLVGAEAGAFFYAGRDEQGHRMDAVAVSGADAADFPATVPVRHTALFEPTFSGEGVVRIDDVLVDPRYGGNDSGGIPSDHAPVRSYLATPVLTHDGRSLGALLFSHSVPGVFGEDDETTAQAVAAQAAVAIENARLFAAEVEARAGAERAARRLQLLQRITALLSTASSTGDIAERVPPAVGNVVGAATCSVLLLDEGTGALLTHTGGRSEQAPWQRQVIAMGTSADTPLRRVIKSREPLYLTVDDMRAVPAVAHLDFCGLSAAMVAPLLARDRRVLGLLTATWTDGAGIDEADRELLVSVAGQVAQALERAQLFDAEQSAREMLAQSVTALTDLARGLQRGLLPHQLPALDRVTVATRYQPAVAGAEVGGDWYDVVKADGKVAFVIGDVQGHSTTAAGLMGQLRTAVRAYVSEGHSPAAALARTNDVMVDLGGDLFATCCLAQLDEVTGELVVASAGHPPPVLVAECGGVAEMEVDPGVPLGIERGNLYPESTERLTGATQVLLYTDGVVESPASGITGGLRRMSMIASAAHARGAEVIADEIMAGIEHRLIDDAALLVLDYSGPDGAADVATMHVDAEASAAARCRRFLRQQLATWEVPRHTVEAAELVLSELVTNAVVHTDGRALVAVQRDLGCTRLRISVHDSSTHRPLAREKDDEALGGRGLVIVAALAQDWGVSLHGAGKKVWAELAVS